MASTMPSQTKTTATSSTRCATPNAACRQRDQQTAPAIQAGTRPDCAPSEFGDDLLEVPSEIGGLGVRLLDIAVTQHFAAHGHALAVTAGRRNLL
jgi:hypothetical protein